MACHRLIQINNTAPQLHDCLIFGLSSFLVDVFLICHRKKTGVASLILDLWHKKRLVLKPKGVPVFCNRNTFSSSSISVVAVLHGCRQESIENPPGLCFMLMSSCGPKQQRYHGDLITPTTVIQRLCSPSPWDRGCHMSSSTFWPHS